MAESSIEPSEVSFKEKQKLFQDKQNSTEAHKASIPTISGGSSVPYSAGSSRSISSSVGPTGRSSSLSSMIDQPAFPRFQTRVADFSQNNKSSEHSSISEVTTSSDSVQDLLNYHNPNIEDLLKPTSANLTMQNPESDPIQEAPTLSQSRVQATNDQIVKRVELKQKQHPRMKNWSGDEKKGATDGRPSHKQSAKTKLKVEGSRTVWGTMHSTSVSALSNAIKSLSDVDVNTLVIKYKYKSKWWFVIRGQESTLKILDENWELVALHTNWKLQPLLRFDGTVNDPTATSDGASKDAAGEIGPEIETVGTSKTQIILQDLADSRHKVTQLTSEVERQQAELHEVTRQRDKLMTADQELEESRHKVAVLTVGMDRQMEKIHLLTLQKDALLGELDAQRLAAQTFEEDFMQERKDRECAFSKCIEMEQRYIHQVQSLAEELGETNMKNDVCLRKENEDLQRELERCQEIIDSLQLQNTVESFQYRQKFHETFSQMKVEHTSELSSHTGLPGVEVVGQTSLVVTNSAKTFQWKGYGFNLHVPADSLPANVDSCFLHVYASISGQYQFPENQELVSAVYWVRCEPPCQFKRLLMAEFQHCAKKTKLTFVRAFCSQSTLPYVFKKILGHGTFTDQSSYGIIPLDHFCGFAVTGDGPIERLYTASLYYRGRDVRSWEIDLAVTWDDQPHVTRVTQHYKERGAIEGPNFAIEFEGEKIELDIPMEGIPIGEWRIRPLVLPMLAQKSVDHFKPGMRIPCCHLTAKFLQHGVTPNLIPELFHLLSLKGAKEPNNVITIKIDPTRTLREQAQTRVKAFADASPTVTLDQLLRHTGTTEDRIDQECTNDNLSKIAPHLTNWFKYAMALRLTDLEIQEIHTDLLLDATMKAHKALQRWHQVNGFQATYRRLIDVCLKHRDVLVAEEICKLLI